MKTRRTVVPDSEDDAMESGTSVRGPSPLRQVESQRPGGPSHSTPSTTRIIQDTEDEDDLGLGPSNNVASNKPESAKVEVVVSAKDDASTSDSTRSSLGVTSADGATGSNTPATSVGAAGDSDAKPRGRVNASTRAQQLRSNAASRRASQRGTKRSIATATADEEPEDSDAALAHFLQMAEYETPRRKRRMVICRAGCDGKRIPRKFLPSASPVSHDGGRSLSLSSLSPEPADLYESEYDSDATEAEGSRAPVRNLSHRRVYAIDERSEDGEDLPPSWEEQRKARRVSSGSYQTFEQTDSPLNKSEADRKKLEQKHPVLKTMWDDLKARPTIAPKAAPQPQSITRVLKHFQLEGLNWMMEQEKTTFRGGLLGDEMGMGKTIQAVSLIMSDFPQPNPTLVIVPPVALMQWVSEIKEYTDGKLKVLVYHNSDTKVKKLTETDIRQYDVIMISYSSLESIHRKQEKGWSRDGGTVKEDSVIHAVDYHRLVLDEAHSIKQRSTGVAKACFALNANYKWCLSGTPVQNRIGEFFSLLRFLQVRPVACYFCKQCSCEQLQWCGDKQGRCTECSHTSFSHVSVFNKEILNPITEGRTEEERKKGLSKLRLITDQIMLRRMKQSHTSSLELPPKRITLHREFFGEIERDFSRSIMTNTGRQFDTYVSRGVMLNNYANIFGLIMQMRQVANHPDLILKKEVEPGHNVLVCRVCDEPAEDAIRSRCRHDFCRQCAHDYIRSFGDESTVECPQCHIPLSIDLEQPTNQQSEGSVKKNSIINRILMKDWTSSTKIEMLLYDLYKQRSKSHTPKSIIFSQFTSMLQLVEWRLRHAGFTTVMLDGSMTPAQRQKSIEYFMKNAEVEVFLVSLKAGGVALNLTEASRVFIVDPWWNPAAEWQSADRSHRIGQQRPCVITRLSIEDSVESRIVQLQEKKANLIRGTINKDESQALEKLTPEDMQFLFRGS
ncbi:DNA repair protein RAD16 [Penicillium capsulatum]|uniref:DNA repair protein RAD16 n=1 Tax=Penicillium capsulatum TaxID=69766 RepID=A0A9W9HWZ1_9EURO|nr:DNA repair protein RAD16 [Penicillium capsulatum]KAJ6106740.1 DNA repair protein RAD16 [Penicillium capsulatum]